MSSQQGLRVRAPFSGDHPVGTLDCRIEPDQIGDDFRPGRISPPSN